MADGTAQQMAAYVRQAAIAAGYDIDAPRSGDKTRLANDAGVSLTTLSRLLSAERLPDPRYYEGIAKALKVDPIELLQEGGVLAKGPIKVLRQPATPEEAADELGIHDEAERAQFIAMVQLLGERSKGRGQRRPAPARYLVADLWLNPEDQGRYARVDLYATNDASEAHRAVEVASARYGNRSPHRVWAVDILDPKQVKDISVLFAECAEAEEDFT